MKKLSKISVLLLSIVLASCGQRIKPYNPSSDNKPESFNFTAKDVVSKLSKDFTLKETTTVNNSKEFTLVNKYSPSYKIVVSAKDINSNVQAISIEDNLGNKTESEAENNLKYNTENHHLTEVQFERIKKNMSFLSCSNENSFLKTDFVCDGSYKVEDKSLLTGINSGILYSIAIFPLRVAVDLQQTGDFYSTIAILPIASN